MMQIVERSITVHICFSLWGVEMTPLFYYTLIRTNVWFPKPQVIGTIRTDTSINVSLITETQP